jgi:hypothetical protein
MDGDVEERYGSMKTTKKKINHDGDEQRQQQ